MQGERQLNVSAPGVVVGAAVVVGRGVEVGAAVVVARGVVVGAAVVVGRGVVVIAVQKCKMSPQRNRTAGKHERGSYFTVQYSACETFCQQK
jgi:acyl-[acyl carrier protein]--UDP-N-acetylglucosamine O-acyltransferase